MREYAIQYFKARNVEFDDVDLFFGIWWANKNGESVDAVSEKRLEYLHPSL